MTSEGRKRSNANLKRGSGHKLDGTERGRALAKQEQRLQEAVEEPALAIRRMFMASAKATCRAYEKLLRTGQRDSDLVDLSRECRRLAERVIELNQANAQDREADGILEAMDAAVARHEAR